jgi:hypothetical protein
MKKFRAYFNYFKFIYKYWDLQLALFTIYYEIIGERKYGIDSTGTESLWQYDIGEEDLSAAEAYQPSGYYILEKLMDRLPDETKSGGLYDFGCGKGRTLVVAMAYGFKKLTGIEIIYELARDAEENIKRSKVYSKEVKYSIINQRAQDSIISDDSTVFLFFNPFKDYIMSEVLGNILDSYQRAPRTLYVVYINDVYKHLFLDKGFKEYYHIEKLTYQQGTILVYG